MGAKFGACLSFWNFDFYRHFALRLVVFTSDNISVRLDSSRLDSHWFDCPFVMQCFLGSLNRFLHRIDFILLGITFVPLNKANLKPNTKWTGNRIVSDGNFQLVWQNR